MNHTSLGQNAAVAVINVAAVGLFGIVGAYWTWQWFSPRPEPRLLASAEPDSQIAVAPGLFGQPASVETGPTAAGDSIRLAGIVAATAGRDAYAIVVLNNQQILATKQGEEVTPGIRLVEVATYQVVLERNGVREVLALPEKVPAANNVDPRISK